MVAGTGRGGVGGRGRRPLLSPPTSLRHVQHGIEVVGGAHEEETERLGWEEPASPPPRR